MAMKKIVDAIRVDEGVVTIVTVNKHTMLFEFLLASRVRFFGSGDIGGSFVHCALISRPFVDPIKSRLGFENCGLRSGSRARGTGLFNR